MVCRQASPFNPFGPFSFVVVLMQIPGGCCHCDSVIRRFNCSSSGAVLEIFDPSAVILIPCPF